MYIYIYFISRDNTDTELQTKKKTITSIYKHFTVNITET